MKKITIALTALMTLTNVSHAISNNRCIDKYDQYHKHIKKVVSGVRSKARSFENCVDKRLAYTSGSCSTIKALRQKAWDAMDSLESIKEDLNDYAYEKAYRTGDKCMDSGHDTIAEDLWELQEFAEDEAEKMKDGSGYSSIGDYYSTILLCADDLHWELKKRNCN